MSESELKGSCLCGGVRYVVHGSLEPMASCYCVQCRKASGAEFATNASVAAASFELLEGESLLREFESSPGQRRIFCGRCGSPIMKRKDSDPERVRLRLGCLDSAIDAKPVIRVFTAERASWTEIPDDVPSFDTLPVGTK
jgi:hypothetical protein